MGRGRNARPTKGEYEEYLDNTGVPTHEEGRIPNWVSYGQWLRKHDKIMFDIGYNEYIAEHNRRNHR